MCMRIRIRICSCMCICIHVQHCDGVFGVGGAGRLQVTLLAKYQKASWPAFFFFFANFFGRRFEWASKAAAGGGGGESRANIKFG